MNDHAGADELRPGITRASAQVTTAAFVPRKLVDPGEYADVHLPGRDSRRQAVHPGWRLAIMDFTTPAMTVRIAPPAPPPMT
jgi:hypothetical protein